jgi:phospholipid/cholesterol/gamma-HCH transport system substrate-binding protein
MQVTRTTEIWVGAFVALGLVALFFVAMQVSNLGDFKSSRGSYILKAHFGNVGGLKVRAPVSMAGVTLGRVEKISFDNARYEALVEMRIDPSYKQIPEDTSASILTAGLLGEQYIGLSAGGSEEYFKEGDEIELTQSAVILEQLISRFMFNKAEEGKADPKKAAQDSSPAPVVTAVTPAPIAKVQQANDTPVVNAPADAVPRSGAAEETKHAAKHHGHKAVAKKQAAVAVAAPKASEHAAKKKKH